MAPSRAAVLAEAATLWNEALKGIVEARAAHERSAAKVLAAFERLPSVEAACESLPSYGATLESSPFRKCVSSPVSDVCCAHVAEAAGARQPSQARSKQEVEASLAQGTSAHVTSWCRCPSASEVYAEESVASQPALFATLVGNGTTSEIRFITPGNAIESLEDASEIASYSPSEEDVSRALVSSAAAAAAAAGADKSGTATLDTAVTTSLSGVPLPTKEMIRGVLPPSVGCARPGRRPTSRTLVVTSPETR